MRSLVARVQKVDWILITILSLGLALRLWGIGFGLPYMYHPDEGVPVNIALRIVRTGNLNPGFYNWPSLLFYLNALLYFGYFVWGRWSGVFASPLDLRYPDVEIMAVGKAALPAEFLLGRGLAAFVGALSVLWVYLICRSVTRDRSLGWLAALLLAVESVSVKNSQFIRPDILAVFFALMAVYFSLRIVDEPRLRYYVLAGIGAGLATSSKYNLALVVIPILVAHLVRFRGRALFRKEIYVAALFSLVFFFLTTPFALLDSSRFLQTGLIEDASHYAGGHPGAEQGSLQWYASFLWQTQGGCLLLAIAQAVVILFRRQGKAIVLLSFPLTYFVFVSLYPVHFDSTILPVIPFVIVLAVLFLGSLFALVFQRWSDGRALRGVAFGGAAVILAFPLLAASAANNVHILQPDGREQAREWIDANLPGGSRIALEAYSPYVDQNKFVVAGYYGLQDHSPDWYVSNGFEYLVFSEEMFGRYFVNPELYPNEVARYNSFFSRFQQVARFDENNFEVRIYRTGITLPSHRVAARFGDYGEIIELVGYDDVEPKWMPGQPLQVRLAWRTLAEKSEPLQVSLRLLDQDDREVASTSGDLFQGKGWREGIFSTDWTIPLKSEIAPGAYRLEVNVIQARINYRAPAKNWAGDNIERVAPGPFKLSALPPSSSDLQAAQPAKVRFGESIKLFAYTANTGVRAGESLPLTLYWQTAAKPPRDYTVFVHLVDADGKVVAQVDAQPHGGAYPTSLWDVDEIVRDDYALQVPAGLAPGSYRIEIGLYEYPSLARLGVVDVNGNGLGDHWILPSSISVVS